MLLSSNRIDDESVENEIKPMKKSTYIIQNVLLLVVCFILLLCLIIFLSVVQNLPSALFLLILISTISMLFLIGIRSTNFWMELKQYNLPNIPRNILAYIVKVASISLTLFLGFFMGSLMTPVDFGYGSFATFVLFLISTFSLIWILTLIIYILILCVGFVWKKCLFIRQQLSPKLCSFFLASFLICSLFMYFIALAIDAEWIGFGLGLALAFSITLFTSGITGAIIYYSKRSKLISIFFSSIGCVGIIFILSFYLNDGYDMKINVIIPSERLPNNLTNDPSLNGNHSVSFLIYGSGSDKRIDYGTKATIITPTIDLSSIIQMSSLNRKAFQFNESALPLNGRIWYPSDRTGPYPVVLMVHGNHISTESSEIGYDYLGKMLARQGFITISVDENFLNRAFFTSVTELGTISKLKNYIFNSITGAEYMARAIILLETLKQFRIWNDEVTNPLYHQFDLSNVGLMGHSRGGESIVIAYLFNQLNYLPEYPSNVQFTNYHFGIKVLFSISGTEDGYMPLGQTLQYSDVTLFAMHGIYDGDVNQFLFQSKIANLKFTTNSSYHFKASLYIHQANHGQFNNHWGKYDLIPGINQLMNVRPLIKMEEQQYICQIYMSALMMLVLKNQTEYRIIFEDYRSISNYLPHTNYISTFQDSNEIIIADFENYDVTQGTMIGSSINATNLLLWSSVYIQIYRSVMLFLQPKENLTGTYDIHLENPINGSSLRFLVGRTYEGLVDYLIVRVFYETGTSESFDVRVLPALTKQIYKIRAEEYVIAVQTIALPLAHPITGVEFVVNGTNAQFLLDNVVIVK